MDFRLGLIFAAVATAGLLGAVYVWRRKDIGLLVAGFRRGLLAGVVIFAITVLLLTLLLNGRPFIFAGALDLGGAFSIGLFVGAVLGIGFVWIGLVLAAIGVLIRPNEMWAKFGAWIAVPIVVIAAGFGVVSFNAFEEQRRQPTVTGGGANVFLAGASADDFDEATEAVVCRFHPDGSFGVEAEFRIGQPDYTSVQILLDPDDEVELLTINHARKNAISGKGFEAQDAARVVTKTASSGEIEFTDVVPLTNDREPDPVERWSGTFTWSCRR